MLVFSIILEGLALCFWLLLVCVVGIANGPVGLVVFYEKNVQERVVELGLTTKKKINKTMALMFLALYLPLLTFVPAAVYLFNGASGFMDGFAQMTAVYMIMNLFDRFFIDVYWVGHTRAWVIPGTEDLMPYIPVKVHLMKWTANLISLPAIAALIAWVIELIR